MDGVPFSETSAGMGTAQAISLGPEHFHLVSDPMEWPGLVQDGIDLDQSPVPSMQLLGHCIKTTF
jgi:hypothetical protein